VQDNRLSLAPRQSAEGSREGQRVGVRPVYGPVESTEGNEPLRASPPADGEVVQDTSDPGLGMVHRTDLGPMLPGTKEALLDEVLGSSRVAGQYVGLPEKAGTVPTEEEVEFRRGFVPALPRRRHARGSHDRCFTAS